MCIKKSNLNDILENTYVIESKTVEEEQMNKNYET